MMNRSIIAIERCGAALLSVALLLPVADAPWFSFWREWATSIAALLVILGAVAGLRDAGQSLRLSARSLGAVAMGLALLCWVQFGIGLVPYHSDALVPSLYLVGFALCVIAAGSLPESERAALADRLAAAMLVAALVSVPLALLQWVGWLRLDLGMRVQGGRPVAHMEQANLLCSLLIQGLCGAWRLVSRGRLASRVALAMCVLLLLTIVLTQSRVAWIATLAFVGMAAWRRDVFDWRSHWRGVLTAVIILLAGTLLLPWIDSQLGLPGASLSERVSEGRRPAAWMLFIEAALSRPWLGWGVLQNGTAQFVLADRHPALGYIFSSTHNVVLDLVVWFGIPVGLFAGAALLFAVVRRIARAPTSAALATVMAALALVLHALVELPLQYAYFLLPLGLYIGITTSERTQRSGHYLQLRADVPGLLPATSLAAAALLATLGQEYIRVTDIRPIFLVDKATLRPQLEATLPLPDVVLLDQLKAFHAFAALPLQSGLSSSQLDAAKTAMRRAPYSSAIERYAILAGLNGRESDSMDALRRVCKFETRQQCLRSQYAWGVWRERWPALPIGSELIVD
jgi:O-antigen ligase